VNGLLRYHWPKKHKNIKTGENKTQLDIAQAAGVTEEKQARTFKL
jgi:hypothetical protein